MTYRPYPEVARALRQLDRRYPPQASPLALALAQQANDALAAAGAKLRPTFDALAELRVTPPRIQLDVRPPADAGLEVRVAAASVTGPAVPGQPLPGPARRRRPDMAASNAQPSHIIETDRPLADEQIQELRDAVAQADDLETADLPHQVTVRPLKEQR